MKIQDNILKFYLKNCYFITGTAYAGKSTMCSMLSKKYNMLHCEENYNMDTILSAVDEQNQPNLNYFNTMPSWQHYVSRTPKEFYDWYNGVSEEVAEFEVAELNSPEVYEAYLHSGFFTLIRENTERDTREEVLQKLAEHFELN